MAEGDVFRVSRHGLGPDGEAIVNSWHYQQVSAGDAPAFAAVAAAFDSHMNIDYFSSLTADYTGDFDHYEWVSGDSLGSFYDNFAINGTPGDDSGDSLPMQVCAIIRRQGSFSSRTNFGRIFLSPVSVDHIDVNGQADVSYAPWVALAAAMQAVLVVTGISFNPVLFQEATLVATSIATTAVGQVAGSRRSRRLRLPN